MKDRILLCRRILIHIVIYAVSAGAAYGIARQICLMTVGEHGMLSQFFANLAGAAVLWITDRRLPLELSLRAQKEQGAERGVRKILLWIVICLCASVALNDLLALPAVREILAGRGQLGEMYGDNTLFLVLGAVVTGPLAEELLYRGVLYRGLKALTGILPAALLSAGIFGVLHMNPLQGIFAGILGLLFAAACERTGGLWGPVLAHMAVNLLGIVMTRNGWSMYYGSGSNVMAACTAVCTAVCLLLLWKEFKGRKKKCTE